MRPWWVAVAMLLLPLSGCSDQAPGGAPEDGGNASGEDSLGGADALALAPLVLDPGVPLSGTIGLEGTFPVADTCNSNPARGCVERTHDLGDQLPAGLPMKVTVDITWASNDLVFHMEAWVQGEGMVMLRVDNSTVQPGHWQWSALVIPGAASEVVVISGGPHDPAQPDSDYHVDVNFTASNQTVPGMVPVAVSLGPNGTFAVQSQDGAGVEFLLYGPDDRFLSKGEGELTLPADAPTGDFIVLPLATSVVLAQGGGELRLPGVAFTQSDVVTVPSGSSATTTVTAHTAPFLAGAFYSGQQQLPMMVAVAVELALTGPDGTGLVTAAACQPFCLGGFTSSWRTDFGVPLTEGAYELTVQSQAAQDTYAGAFVATFDRSML